MVRNPRPPAVNSTRPPARIISTQAISPKVEKKEYSTGLRCLMTTINDSACRDWRRPANAQRHSTTTVQVVATAPPTLSTTSISPKPIRSFGDR